MFSRFQAACCLVFMLVIWGVNGSPVSQEQGFVRTSIVLMASYGLVVPSDRCPIRRRLRTFGDSIRTRFS